ncbi:hypothetical protein Tco_1327506 [Tanacetum coccineum]
MVSATKDPLTFNNLMATPIDFSKYVLNRLKIENLNQDLLLGPAYNLLKGTCTSSIELEYNFQECFNALTDKLDWNNLEGDRNPFDLSKTLPLQGRPGHLTVAVDYFFNKDLEYLKTSDPEKTYTTSITKTKAARYEIVGIEDMNPMLWSTIKWLRLGIRSHDPARTGGIYLGTLHSIIKVLRYATKGVKVRKGKIQTKTELTLEQTQQGVSDEVLVGIEGVEQLKRNLLSGIEDSHHGPSDAMHNPSQPFKNIRLMLKSIHSDDGNPSGANIKQALWFPDGDSS